MPDSETGVHVRPASSERIRPEHGRQRGLLGRGVPGGEQRVGPVERDDELLGDLARAVRRLSRPGDALGPAPSRTRNSPVLVDIQSTPSAGLTASDPTTGSSPSGSTHGTASAAPEPRPRPRPRRRTRRARRRRGARAGGRTGRLPAPASRRFVVYSCVCGFSRGRRVDGITRWSTTVHVSRPRVMSDW